MILAVPYGKTITLHLLSAGVYKQTVSGKRLLEGKK